MIVAEETELALFRQLEVLPEPTQHKLNELRTYLAKLDKTYVAYSGGVDSTLVAAIAKEQLGEKAIAITGVSPALASELLKEARAQAEWLGIKHEECITSEIKDPNYSNNPKNRCFACKSELHTKIRFLAKKTGSQTTVDGINKDDLGDYRPGIDASRAAGVRSPLADLNITKLDIRNISKALGFPWWDKPAQPCLASRFPYGEQITTNRLNQVEKAEAWIRKHGFSEVRVRMYGVTAQIEIPEHKIKELLLYIDRKELLKYFNSIGFSYISLDLEGFISGKFNRKIL